MKNKLWAVLGRLIVFALILSPVLFVYFLVTDPVNAIIYTAVAWLVLVFVVLPIIALLLFSYVLFAAFGDLLKSVYELLKSAVS